MIDIKHSKLLMISLLCGSSSLLFAPNSQAETAVFKQQNLSTSSIEIEVINLNPKSENPILLADADQDQGYDMNQDYDQGQRQGRGSRV